VVADALSCRNRALALAWMALEDEADLTYDSLSFVVHDRSNATTELRPCHLEVGHGFARATFQHDLTVPVPSTPFAFSILGRRCLRSTDASGLNVIDALYTDLGSRTA
jgi:hypothetical protein